MYGKFHSAASEVGRTGCIMPDDKLPVDDGLGRYRADRHAILDVHDRRGSLLGR